MQGMSCMMMMKEAMKMPPGPEKNMMMMMAMQQCAQAAQSAANAAQNKDGAKKLADNTPTASPTLKTQPFQAPQAQKEEQFDASKYEKKDDSPDPTPPDLSSSDSSPPEKDAPVNIPKSDFGKAFTMPSFPSDPLPKIDRAKLGFDESTKLSQKDSSSSSTNGYNPRGMNDSASSLKTDSISVTPIGIPGLVAAIPRAGKGGGSDYGSASDSGSGSKSEGSANPFESMLGLLGGGGEAKGGSDIFFGADGGLGGGGANAPAGPNLFEIAHERYHKAAYEEAKIRTQVSSQRKAAGPTAPTTTTVARAPGE